MLGDAAIELIQPIRPALDPICESVSYGSSLIVVALRTYPEWVKSVALAPVLALLNTCAQVQAP